MAATLTKFKGRGDVQLGAKVEGSIIDFKGDAAYATGGYVVTPAAVGLKRIIAIVDLGPITAGATGKVVEYDQVNAKLKVLVSAAAASPLQEVANASDQSGVTRRLLCLGN